jgi:hypothetical protein
VHRSGEIIPASGIYRVQHHEHRLPHEVTLFRGEMFPPCSKCANAVTFVPIHLADKYSSGHIVLHHLPVLDDEADAANGSTG